MNVQKMMPITSKDSDVKDSDSRGTIKVIDRPTFILKTREGENRAVSPNQRNGGNKKKVMHLPMFHQKYKILFALYYQLVLK